jgi:hypothetical protein
MEFALSALDLPIGESETNMKKQNRTKRHSGDSTRAEYDFSKGVRGKHAASYASGTNVVVLEPDVASKFPTAEDVNETLRAVARLLERRTSRRGKSKTA